MAELEVSRNSVVNVFGQGAKKRAAKASKLYGPQLTPIQAFLLDSKVPHPDTDTKAGKASHIPR